jgi:cysteine synthase A
MGNSASTTDAAAPEAPTDAQVNDLYDALAKVFDEKAVSDGIAILDKEALLMKLRRKFEREVPSAMGCPRIDPDISQCIGQTKLVRINKINAPLQGEVVAKLEFLNPGLSVKDRIARSMIEDAEAKGLITPGVTTIVDVTSGNTGIAYGVVAAAKGYKAILIIPEPYSVERRAMMMALGVEVIVSKKEDSIPGAIKVYQETLDRLGDKGWAPGQFGNPANIAAHTEHTGPEIWEQCGGKVDAFVAGMGTGGTLTGVTQYLRSKNPNLLCIAVEPMEQSLLNGDGPAPHGVQGVSPPFLPDNVQVDLIDEVIRCPTAEAFKTAKELATLEGIACGISAGLNVWAACQLAKRPEMAGKRIVTVLPSAAERYFSTPLYADLVAEAKALPLATFHAETPTDGIAMNTLASLKEKGVKLRPGFHVS